MESSFFDYDEYDRVILIEFIVMTIFSDGKFDFCLFYLARVMVHYNSLKEAKSYRFLPNYIKLKFFISFPEQRNYL